MTPWLGYRRYLLNKWVSTIKPHWKSDLLTKENSFQPGFVILVAMVTENHHFGNRHYFQGWTPRTKVAEYLSLLPERSPLATGVSGNI